MNSPPSSIVSIVAVVLCSACNLVKLTADSTADVLEVAMPAFNQESDVELARAAAPGQLKTVEGFHLASPGNPKMIRILAQGYCEFAFGFLEDDVEKLAMAGKADDAAPVVARATGLYLRCMNYGLKLLGGDWQKAIYGDIAVFDAKVKDAGKDQVAGMFWTAFGLAGAININRDDIELVAYLPKARLLFERVVALDEGFHHASAHMALGMLFTSQSAAVGGNPERGRKHFERAIQLTKGRFLMPRVLYAMTYGTMQQNQKFFHDGLTAVLRTSPAVWPEQRLANELAHLRARRYLAYEKELF